ncbi:hypothetical protein Nepgr_003508 [Nepenthes gracilis]|uniref:Exocyst component Exo84 C-terminal domain-containing protein n=1 Tax=Nepenthes gracilis TaxID=150966 RepID=A0AAD3RZS1_NEPGR|nr:hypothetical protein Nepgr_003508 [Nepenthes gracilis]
MHSAYPRHASRDSSDFEPDNELSLSDRLKVFKSSQFDPDAYLNSKCQNISEKGIRQLCVYLKDLKRESAEEMRRSVFANYSAFIRTAKEISALEGQLISMRNLLSAQVVVTHGLADGSHIDIFSTGHEGSTDEDISGYRNKEISEIENWLGEFLETLEVLLAERTFEKALAALDGAESMAKEAKETRTLSPTTLISLQTAVTEQKQKLADLLVEAACQPSTQGAELRSVVCALKKLGDGPHAHSLLLNAHRQKLQLNLQNLRPVGALNGGACTASLSRLFFSAIAQAANDSLIIFGEETLYTSELVAWAVQETERFSLLVKRYSLAVAAAAGNLRAAKECAHVCFGHCSLLEERGLVLSPVLSKHFRPCVAQALTVYLKRIERSSAVLAADEDWSLTNTTGNARLIGVSSQPKLSRSAHRFNSMVQELFEDVDTLEIMQLVNPTLEGVLRVFSSYVNIMINALPGSINEAIQEGTENTVVKQAETEAQQLALLANALMLADELLSRTASRLLPSNQTSSRPDERTRRGYEDRQIHLPEQREWKRQLQRLVDNLRDSYCRQHALELIFTDDGDIRLNSQLYTSLDDYAGEPEWFPSQIFQEFFVKLAQIASIASDMFFGRERFATVLLMRLTETLMLWLSDDQTFWEEIEQGPKPLGPLGLQQFYLDMEFVILFSLQGRYLSRNLQQVSKNVIARAIDAVAATGVDPYSTLPEEEWFADVAQIAIKMLMGKSNFGDVDGEAFGPTASTLKCNPEDLEALASFKAGIHLNSSGWLAKWAGCSCCEWDGIECDNMTGRMIKIHLPGFVLLTKMEGLMSSSLTLLTLLEVIDLGGLNYCLVWDLLGRVQDSGKIPGFLRMAPSPLLELDLSANPLTGSIPSWIRNLSSLYSLNLSANSLVSDLAETVTMLHDLGMLYLHSDNLLGYIANVFDIGSRLTGELLASIGELGLLVSLDLSCNYFESDIAGVFGERELSRVSEAEEEPFQWQKSGIVFEIEERCGSGGGGRQAGGCDSGGGGRRWGDGCGMITMVAWCDSDGGGTAAAG